VDAICCNLFVSFDLHARGCVKTAIPRVIENAVAVLLLSGRDQPSSWARWTFRRETGSAAYPAPPS
jgi:hypothetical protein